jgi:capsid protein
MREDLIGFIRENFPDYLPRSRMWIDPESGMNAGSQNIK